MFRLFKVLSRIRVAIVAALFSIGVTTMLVTSCANIGTPTGGLKDTLAPVIVRMTPSPGELNFKKKEIYIEFDEFVVYENINEKLTISPPLEKKPIVKLKGRGILLKLEGDKPLKDNTTYSIDFKDAIADNNEKNIYENLRYTFSTGKTIDTMRIAGIVKDAYTLEALEGIKVLLYKNITDSLPEKGVPDYTAITNKDGIFLAEGLADGDYKIFAVEDNDKNNAVNLKGERYAYLDSMVTTTATFIPGNDTLVERSDTLLVYGHVRFGPTPLFLRLFEQESFFQVVNSYKRVSREKFYISFTECLTDSFSIKVLDYDSKGNNPLYYEKVIDDKEISKSLQSDSLLFWITDTTLLKRDTLNMEVRYTVLDSMEIPIEQVDTLDMYFKEVIIKEKKKRGRRKKSEAVKKSPLISIKLNAGSDFDRLDSVILSADNPISYFDRSALHLYKIEDTIETIVDHKLIPLDKNLRKYKVLHDWKYGDEYKLTIDSASVKSIYGIGSDKFSKKFSFKRQDQYGTISILLSNVTAPLIVQLLKNDKEEELIQEQRIETNKTVKFIDLTPDKYLIKIIFDLNKNGVWDSGDYEDNILPESIIYYQEVIKLRANWDSNKVWVLPKILNVEKNINDPEAAKERTQERQKREREGMKM